MAFAIFQAHAVDQSGLVLPGAEVEVLIEATSVLATDLFQDRAGTLPKANPFFADPDGYFYFFAPGRAYRVTVRKDGFERVWRYVAVGLNAESDSASASVAGSNQEVQFNDGGTLGADPDFKWNKTTNTLTLNGTTVVTGKGSAIGTASGLTTALAPTDANILLYNFGSNNWAGIGTANSGDIWFRTGLSGTPDARLVIGAADGGIQVPATVSGGSKGHGTINATALYQNGVALGALATLNSVGSAQITDGSIANADLANMPTGTLKGRGSAGTGVPEDIIIGSGLTITAGPTLNATGGGGGSGMSGPPGGRLTLTSGVPVMFTSTAGGTFVYYTPYVHNQILIYNGSSFTPTAFAELVQATGDATKSPAAVAANQNYDIFVWSDGGTMRATRGPPWSTATSRGSGAGTTELVRVQGVWLNAQNITNGPAAQRGTYVGTIRSNGAAQIDYVFGGAAAGGQPGSYGVWNCYNRRLVAARVSDTTTSWPYSSATIRAANGSAGNRVNFVMGLPEDGIAVSLFATPSSGTVGAFGRAGPGLDTTTNYEARATFICGSSSATLVNAMTAVWNYDPQIGFHFISANEVGDGTNTISWNGSTPSFNCLAVSLVM